MGYDLKYIYTKSSNMSSMYLGVNRNKGSIVLDLKKIFQKRYYGN